MAAEQKGKALMLSLREVVELIALLRRLRRRIQELERLLAHEIAEADYQGKGRT